MSGLRGRSPANSDTAITIARTRVATSTQENEYPRTQWGMGHPTKASQGTYPRLKREARGKREAILVEIKTSEYRTIEG